MTLQWFLAIAGVVFGSGLVSVFTIPSAIKKAKAEAKKTESEAKEPEIEGWKKLVDELQEQNKELREQNKEMGERIKGNEGRIDELNARVDGVYKLLGEERKEKNELLAKVTKLEAQIEIDRPKLCNVPNCPNRDPKSEL